ncbi:hypothetical protein [Candidatus Methylobacter oryzae]|uniref:hypothetical protein n=1 Tax=Candidatus Methylobacter oryzae TaxID=2497749 RepID=UPI0019D540D8|nr:hypothetical protein [Candidatus Methylobacter oryzae]
MSKEKTIELRTKIYDLAMQIDDELTALSDHYNDIEPRKSLMSEDDMAFWESVETYLNNRR